MKKFLYAVPVLALLLPAAVVAQQKMGDMKTPDASMKSSSEAKMAHQAVGVVKKVDTKTGVATLTHEAVNSLKWPAMTMGFRVKDKMLFDKLIEGRTVHFEFVQEPKGYVITQVK